MSIYYDDDLGIIWGSSGRHVRVIWEPFGSHLGSIWRHLGGWMPSGGQISDYLTPSATECKSSINISISRGGFEGTINYDCIFTATSAADTCERFEV